MSASIAQPRFNMLLIIGLALSAAALAAVGVYGLVTYAVTRRTVEIGVRAALGAQPGQTFALVVVSALRLVGVGVVAGLAGAAALGRSLESLLFGVSAFDPLTYATAGLGRGRRGPGGGRLAGDSRVADRSGARAPAGVANPSPRAEICTGGSGLFSTSLWKTGPTPLCKSAFERRQPQIAG